MWSKSRGTERHTSVDTMPSERGLFAFAKWIWYGVCSIRVARVLPDQHLYMRLGRLSGPCVQEYVRSHRPSSYTAVPYSCLTDEAPYKRPTGVAWKMFAVFFVLGGVCSTLIPLTYGSTRLKSSGAVLSTSRISEQYVASTMKSRANAVTGRV